MIKLTKCLCMLALAMPLGALADPVAIVTRTSGTMTTNDTVMGWLGLAAPPGLAILPYELTIRTVMDPQAPGFDGSRGYWVQQDNSAQLDVTLALGAQTYHYAGLGTAAVSGVGDIYRQHIRYALPGSASGLLIFQNDASIGGMNFGSDSPLHPPQLGEVPSTWAYATVNGVDHPGAPDEEFASMTGDGKVFSVSMVPEPAQGALLAAGMATLLLRTRKPRGSAAARRLGA